MEGWMDGLMDGWREGGREEVIVYQYIYIVC